jgi:hypothetical protein
VKLHRPIAAVLSAVVGLVLAVPASAATPPRVFKNCKAVNKVYAHGIAKNFRVIKKADGLTGRPFVSFKLYTANHTRDRDKDGVACET